jgi:hypothetical protein
MTQDTIRDWSWSRNDDRGCVVGESGFAQEPAGRRCRSPEASEGQNRLCDARSQWTTLCAARRAWAGRVPHVSVPISALLSNSYLSVIIFSIIAAHRAMCVADLEGSLEDNYQAIAGQTSGPAAKRRIACIT